MANSISQRCLKLYVASLATSLNDANKLPFTFTIAGLKQRIVDYYDHMWRHYRSLDGSTALFLPELNSTLGSEVILYMRTTLVTNAPFFAQCSPMLTKELVLSLQTEVIANRTAPGL